MSYPKWNDSPSEMVAMLRHAAMDAVLGQGGLVGQTLYAKAADRINELEHGTMPDYPRCPKTGNLCLTDTWNLDQPPDCHCGRIVRRCNETA